jgi:hypothetical protein
MKFCSSRVRPERQVCTKTAVGITMPVRYETEHSSGWLAWLKSISDRPISVQSPAGPHR